MPGLSPPCHNATTSSWNAGSGEVNLSLKLYGHDLSGTRGEISGWAVCGMGDPLGNHRSGR
ncbi:hypothetical protein GCM10017600_51510 [Streptosporangium carneum]|uniref:Uncharacterized protein n=1 Tax=Streptosporangium carneum TaxID=47481 RepID=A0A9W6I5T5_9ACTN|nr:hypothetical protein GCM10017600_51510 [Streptosporangium carneum]